MARIIIINGSPDPNGYWANEVRGDILYLLTHCAAAKELALAVGRQEEIYWYPTGRVGFFGPLALTKWHREKNFFRFHFGNIHNSAAPLTGRNTAAGEKVHRELGKMRHLIMCGGARVDHVNMEHPSPKPPSPEEVENALRDANVPSA